MKFYIVDAFTNELFGGNPAGVVILPEGADFPSDEICVKTAAELRYSETAFIKRLGEKEFNIRYFTPAAEVELCGHATIGSFAALKYGGYIEDGDFMNHTISGDLNISVKGGRVLMDMAVPVKKNEITSEEGKRELYKIMGLDYDDLKARGLELTPQMISTGLPDIMMGLAICLHWKIWKTSSPTSRLCLISQHAMKWLAYMHSLLTATMLPVT